MLFHPASLLTVGDTLAFCQKLLNPAHATPETGGHAAHRASTMAGPLSSSSMHRPSYAGECMYVCVVRVYASLCVCVRMHVAVCVHVLVHLLACVYFCAYFCACVCLQVCGCECAHVL